VIELSDDVAAKWLNHRGYVWYRKDIQQRLKYVHKSLVASSPLCDSILVEIKCINIRRNTTVVLRQIFIHLISTSTYINQMQAEHKRSI
jgi:hypothetical protein